MNLATKDIQHSVGRFSLTAAGIGLLLMMVMGMGGIYRGLVEDAILMVERIDADLWVVQKTPGGLLPRSLGFPGILRNAP
jgi:putative ABC transport system permease protein